MGRSRTCSALAALLMFVVLRSASAKPNITAIVLLAEGAEAMEIVAPVDLMRHAGIQVTTAGLNGVAPITANRLVRIVPDEGLREAKLKGPYDIVVLPGGFEGARNLAASREVGDLLREQEKSGRLIAAICAAPTALKAHGIGYGKKLTSYPSVKDQMLEGNKYIYLEQKIVVDGKLITSRGPGTSLDFGMAIVEYVFGKKVATEVAKQLIVAY